VFWPIDIATTLPVIPTTFLKTGNFSVPQNAESYRNEVFADTGLII
jgi:hypothetical protein